MKNKKNPLPIGAGDIFDCVFEGDFGVRESIYLNFPQSYVKRGKLFFRNAQKQVVAVLTITAQGPEK